MSTIFEDGRDRPRRRAEGLLSERVGNELVVYDEVTGTAHSLSSEATAVWERCDGSSSLAEIASQLGLPQMIVGRAVDDLQNVDLLIEERGYTRRDAGKRFAAVGGGALAAPLLYSVAVPSAALAVSGHCQDPNANSICDTDWQTPVAATQFVLFTAEITNISPPAPAGTPYTINLTGSTITYNDVE